VRIAHEQIFDAIITHRSDQPRRFLPQEAIPERDSSSPTGQTRGDENYTCGAQNWKANPGKLACQDDSHSRLSGEGFLRRLRRTGAEQECQTVVAVLSPNWAGNISRMKNPFGMLTQHLRTKM
jgi:hypothetical protein